MFVHKKSALFWWKAFHKVWHYKAFFLALYKNILLWSRYHICKHHPPPLEGTTITTRTLHQNWLFPPYLLLPSPPSKAGRVPDQKARCNPQASSIPWCHKKKKFPESAFGADSLTAFVQCPYTITSIGIWYTQHMSKTQTLPAIPPFRHLTIPHTLVGKGSTALAAVVVWWPKFPA